MYTNLMPYRKLIQNKEKMTKTIPLRIYQSLASKISDSANKYGISQQDAIRLAIQIGLKHLDEFLTEQKGKK